MTWFKETKLSWIQRLCLNVLKQGAIPKHVAFIMDGNRRFASKRNMDKIKGHVIGFEKLIQTLEWCLHLGIKEVTVYAFSIENFKRSSEEVNALMELAEDKFEELLKEKEKIVEHGLRIRILGDLSLLPKKLQKLIGEAVLMTEHNDRGFLNVCLAYTSRYEMSLTIDDLAEGVSKGLIQCNDICESLISSTLLLTSEPDLVVRTSGEVRLSDFLLWQSSYSVLAFLKVLWPEFNIWHLFLGVLFYQFSCKPVHKTKVLHASLIKQLEYREDLSDALSLSSCNDPSEERHIEEILPERLIDEKNRRKKEFLDYITAKRREEFVRMKEVVI